MSTGTPPRAARQQFGSHVRIAVQGKNEIIERFASNLSQGGMFIREDAPPAIGQVVLVEFVLPGGAPLARISARVVHSRPATTPGERNAGMGLQFIELDATATQLTQLLKQKQPPSATPPTAPGAPVSRIDTLAPDKTPARMDGIVVGIDLGTVNSCVAIVQDGRPRVIKSKRGYETIPSVVYVGTDRNILVGHPAVERMILEPHRAVYGSKRFLGRPFQSKEVQSLGHFFNYEIAEGPDGRAAARMGDVVVRLEIVAAHILKTLRDMAEQELNTPVRRAIITCPAYFDETQRGAVREAGRLAGLHVERILNEPTAAAVSYGNGRGMKRTALVYDLGGGTFDATLLKIDGDTLEVLATHGDPFLGGSDFDDRLTEYVLMSYEREKGVVLRDSPVAVQRIRFAVELAKRQLSEVETASIDLPFIKKTDKGAVDLKMTLSRSILETLTEDLVDRTMGIVQAVLDQAKLPASQLDDVILVGGQSRSPHVRRRIQERFGKPPAKNVHPDEAVALGAALVANAMYAKSPLELKDILAAAIRIGDGADGTKVLLSRGTKLPAEAKFDILPDQSAKADYKALLFRG
ncbi:MAG TPA: Hsp70 family protein, partial [Myxococcota bacterium]|nr:Hsp70 family protein [Myxococcota bacterium]